jgi:hypothetical protein
MRERSTDGVLFLVSLAALGCPADDVEDMGSTSSGSSPQTESEATSGSASMTGAMPTSGEPSTTTEPTSGSSGGPMDCVDAEPPEVDDISPVCVEYTARTAECYGLPEDCVDYYQAYCEYNLDNAEMMYGADCRSAVEAMFACIAAIECKDVDTGCDAEAMAAEEQCS